MIDYDLEDYMDAYYGSNADELRRIKTEFDPKNKFNWRQSIR